MFHPYVEKTNIRVKHMVMTERYRAGSLNKASKQNIYVKDFLWLFELLDESLQPYYQSYLNVNIIILPNCIHATLQKQPSQSRFGRAAVVYCLWW